MTRASPSPTQAVVAGLLVLVSVMGIGRFAYTPLLPRMQDAMGWSLAQAGDIASANFLGYLLGALASGKIAGRPSRAHWLVGALLARGLDAPTAAQLGVWVHGRAGEQLSSGHPTASGLTSFVSRIVEQCCQRKP